jgi:sRNA-binding protein
LTDILPTPDIVIGDVRNPHHGEEMQKPTQTRRIDFAAADANIRILAELFPACFVAEPHRPHRPLMVGISRTLVEAGVLSAEECRGVFGRYCRRLQYLRGVVAGAARVDLAGVPTGTVTDDDAKWAAIQLDHILKRRADRFSAKLTVRRGVRKKLETDRAKSSAENAAARKTVRDDAGETAPTSPEVVESVPQVEQSAPRRLGLADLKRAAQERQRAASCS